MTIHTGSLCDEEMSYFIPIISHRTTYSERSKIDLWEKREGGEKGGREGEKVGERGREGGKVGGRRRMGGSK